MIGPKIILHTGLLEQLLSTAKLPTPPVQADNLVLWLGDTCVDPGAFTKIDTFNLSGAIGTASASGVEYVVGDLAKQRLLDESRTGSNISIRLTLTGWRHYEALKQGRAESRKAFMAMKFNDPELESMFNEVFRPAVKKTSYDLVSLATHPKAGLIDDHLRVEILTARFVLADLTHDNLGAYWEAGYAEGKGKPVIYTCRKDVFEEKARISIPITTPPSCGIQKM
jgi:hypothetical protein